MPEIKTPVAQRRGGFSFWPSSLRQRLRTDHRSFCSHALAAPTASASKYSASRPITRLPTSVFGVWASPAEGSAQCFFNARGSFDSDQNLILWQASKSAIPTPALIQGKPKPGNHTGNAVVLQTVRSAKLDCICPTPGSRARYWRWMRAKSSVSWATTLSR